MTKKKCWCDYIIYPLILRYEYGSIVTVKKCWCDCGDELVSEEDFRTGICGICRSLENGVEEVKEKK